MVISISILISLAVSLSTTAMMCAVLLRPLSRQGQGRFYRASERFFEAMLGFYRRTLTTALEHPRSVILILLAVLGLNFYLYDVVPKGFFPQQDTGRIIGTIQADQSISFQLMQQKLMQFVSIIKKDPAVETVVGFTGTGQTNSGYMFLSLYPTGQRKISADGVIARLRREMAVVPGATLFLQSVQDIRVGGRASNAQYQYTLQGNSLEELNEWAPKIAAALQREPNLADINSDQQDKGLESDLVIDRDAAAQLGITVGQIDNTLYDAFGQRQVSTIYVARNQYHVGSRAALLAESGDAERRLCQYVWCFGRRLAGHECGLRNGRFVCELRRCKLGQRASRTQSCHQFDRRNWQWCCLDRVRGLDEPGSHDPALRGLALHQWRYAAGGQSPRPTGRDDHLLQSAGKGVAEHRRCRD
jgi:multidrug efflux pump subunit AcrB